MLTTFCVSFCRLLCEILQVHSPQSSANGTLAANGHRRPADGETIVISDSDEESRAFQIPQTHLNGSGGQRCGQVIVGCRGVGTMNSKLEKPEDDLND